MGSKRSALRVLLDPPVKRPRLSVESTPAMSVPQAWHHPHPDCRNGINFHSVPYPLSLLPFESWYALHLRNAGPSRVLEIRCPVCASPEPASLHHQKLFLVAERLLFDLEKTPTATRQRNEEANWEVNFHLGILEPFVEDLEGHIPGGKQSREKRCYPFCNELEMGAVMRLIGKGGVLTQSNWTVWRDIISLLPLDRAGEPRADKQSQPQGQGIAVDVAFAPTGNRSLAMGIREDMLWVEQLGEDDIAESYDHLDYLKEILQKKNEALAMHQATGTPPPLPLTQSRKLIVDDIKETEDIIRTREEIDRRKSYNTTPRERRVLGEADLNSIGGITPASKPPSSAKLPSNKPFPPTLSSTFPLTPPSSLPLKETKGPPSSRPCTSPPTGEGKETPATHPPTRQTTSLRTLPDLYEKFDLIERTSHVGACFLEAYAEFLRWDMCGRCWFREMIIPEREEAGGRKANSSKKPEWSSRGTGVSARR